MPVKWLDYLNHRLVYNTAYLSRRHKSTKNKGVLICLRIKNTPKLREMETNNHPILQVFLSAFSRVATLRSLLCAYCYSTEDKQKSCAISDDYLFPAPLSLFKSMDLTSLFFIGFMFAFRIWS